MSEHEHYAEWDAAYVLGALSPAERAAYERHLTQCTACQSAVAEVAPLPGLLAHVDPDALDTIGEPPADLERRLMAAARPARWRRTSTRVGLGVAAAAVVAAAVALPTALRGDQAGLRNDGRVDVALHSVAGAATPLSAEVALAPAPWGTRVAMTCTYARTGAGYGPRTYALYLVDADGHRQRVSTWRSGPGEVARTAGSTDIPLGDIARVELADAATHTVVLSSVVG